MPRTRQKKNGVGEASRIEVQAGDSGANPIHIKHVRALCQSASLGLVQSRRAQIRLVNYKN